MLIKQGNPIRSLLLLNCLLLFFVSNAQEKFTDNLVVSGNYQIGYIIPEYSVVGYTVDSHIQSFDLSFHKEKTGKDIYEQLYHYPQMGLALFYTTLGNREIYGQAFAANYFFRITLISGKKFRLFNRMGIGLGYLTKTFNLEDNYLNVVIGSHLNIHYNLRFGSSYQISDRMSINAGVSLDHYSNGNTNEPNIGLNLLAAYTGLNYRMGKKLERIENDISPFGHGHTFEVFTSIGAKRTRSFLSNYYVALSTAFEYNYKLSRSVNLGAGIDVFYDSSVKPQLEAENESISPTDNFQTGVHISQTLVYRNFRFTLQEGLYVGLTNQLHHKPIYSRGILKYYINDNFSVRLAMKSHLHILDYPEIGFGYKF